MTNEDAPWRDEGLLRQKYVDEGKTEYDIAEEWDCSRTTINRWLDRHNIPKRNSDFDEQPYQDCQTLRYHFIEKDLSLGEIASKYDVHKGTISKHIQKYGLDKEKYPWRNKDKLRRLYHDEGLSSYEIASRLGCASTTIRNHMEQFGIDRRLSNDNKPPYYHTKKSGHEEIQSTVGEERNHVFIHQLVAVANGEDPYKVFHPVKWVCHHQNEIPWDNRHHNIEVMRRSVHQSLHAKGGWG